MRVFTLGPWLMTFLSVNALAAFPMNEKMNCMVAVNQALSDPSHLPNPDGNALYVDADGKTLILDQSRIRKRSTENGVETITYRAKEPVWDGKMIGVPNKFETVDKTVVIKRDPEGRVIEVSKLYDLERQKKMQEKLFPGFAGMTKPLKSFQSEIAHSSGGGCDLAQSYRVEATDKQGVEVKTVVYDKKFCEKLEPFVRKMGSQNAALCSSLLGTAELAYESRSQELKAEGKKFQLNYDIPNEKNRPLDPTNFSVAAALQSCFMGESPYGMGLGLGGYAGMGFGMGMGGFGGPGGASGDSKSPSKKSLPTSKDSGVR